MQKEMDTKVWGVCEMGQELVECCPIPGWSTGLRSPQGAADGSGQTHQRVHQHRVWYLILPGTWIQPCPLSDTLKDFPKGFQKHQSHIGAQGSVWSSGLSLKLVTDIFGNFLALPDCDLCSLSGAFCSARDEQDRHSSRETRPLNSVSFHFDLMGPEKLLSCSSSLKSPCQEHRDEDYSCKWELLEVVGCCEDWLGLVSSSCLTSRGSYSKNQKMLVPAWF